MGSGGASFDTSQILAAESGDLKSFLMAVTALDNITLIQQPADVLHEPGALYQTVGHAALGFAGQGFQEAALVIIHEGEPFR